MAISLGGIKSGAAREAIPQLPALRRPGLRARLQTLVASTRLDRELAAGADPLGSDKLRVRAERLTTAEHRLEVARRLEEVALDENLVSPFSRKAVRRNRVLMLRLAARLRDPGPHLLPGLAAATLLAHEKTRLLTGSVDPGELRDRLTEALAALAP